MLLNLFFYMAFFALGWYLSRRWATPGKKKKQKEIIVRFVNREPKGEKKNG